MSFKPNVAALLILTCILAGCSSIPLMSMVKLSQFDPLTADPNLIRIAIRTTKVVDLQKGDVKMNLGYVADDNSLVIDDLYLVEVRHNSILSKTLIDGLEEHEAVTVMHLSSSDAKQMRQTQKLIAQRKADDLEGSGSFGVSINSSCLHSDLPQDEMLVDIFLQTDPNEDYFAISEDLDLFQQEGIEDLKQWPKCDVAQQLGTADD